MERRKQSLKKEAELTGRSPSAALGQEGEGSAQEDCKGPVLGTLVNGGVAAEEEQVWSTNSLWTLDLGHLWNSHVELSQRQPGGPDWDTGLGGSRRDADVKRQIETV